MSNTRPERIDVERAFSALSKMGIPNMVLDKLDQDIEFCFVRVKETPEGITPYYYRQKILPPDAEGGIKAGWSWRPLGAAYMCKNAFIGFLFVDGTIRQDAKDLLDSIYISGATNPNWPTHALFWRDHVPFIGGTRPALASHPRDKKIIVTTL